MPDDRLISPTTRISDPIAAATLGIRRGGMVGTIGDYARFAQMLLNGGTLEGRRYLKPETVALMASDHIGPETKSRATIPIIPARPAASASALPCAPRCRRTLVAAGEYRWDGVGGTFFFIDPRTTCSRSSWCRRRRSADGFSWR